jgi:hypothetical protein
MKSLIELTGCSAYSPICCSFACSIEDRPARKLGPASRWPRKGRGKTPPRPIKASYGVNPARQDSRQRKLEEKKARLVAYVAQYGCFLPAASSAFPKEHTSWVEVKRRCFMLKPGHRDYPLYRGRGISMCEEWHRSFDAFIAYMGPKPSPKHTLDRIDPDRNYEPGNCRWGTPKQQGENKRVDKRPVQLCLPL